MIDKERRVAWGVTGSGDRITEVFNIMEEVRNQYDNLDIRVYLSKAGEQVVKMYNLFHVLEENFDRILIERNANLPFLAGELQLGRYDFLLIAPTTSNTAAKISLSLADSLLSNAAIMALKAFIPVYILPSDFTEGTIITNLPDGKALKLRIRKEDVEHVRNLEEMDGVFILKGPDEIQNVFREHYNPDCTRARIS
jgi:archaeoflavoprotein AfpA